MTNVLDIFTSAQDDGLLSPGSVSALLVPDMTQEIQDALSPHIPNFGSAESILLGVLFDDSGSILNIPGGEQAVVAGHNEILNAFRGSKQLHNALVASWTMNHGQVQALISPADAKDLALGVNYRAEGETPLYRRTVEVLGTIAAETQRLLEMNVEARSIVIIVTDGKDEDYSWWQSHGRQEHFKADHCKNLIRDLGENLIVMLIGIEGNADYEQIAADMGIPPRWILKAGANAHDIREKCRLASESAKQASQTAASFSQTALQGFTQ